MTNSTRRSAHYGLTDADRAHRDTRIRELTADGLTVNQIATQIGCTERTVYNVRAATPDVMHADQVAEADLLELAALANRHHADAETAIGDAVRHARKAGDVLCAAKQRLRHGEWAFWLEANFRGSARTARAYMQLSAANRQSSAIVPVDTMPSINAALKAIRKPTPSSPPAAPPAIPTPDTPSALDPDDDQCSQCGDKDDNPRLIAEIDKHRAKLDADWAAHVAAYNAQNQRINAMRDEERRRYQEGIAVQRAKGLITPADYALIRACLHPDSRHSVTADKLASAYRVFNDSRIKTLLVKETTAANR